MKDTFHSEIPPGFATFGASPFSHLHIRFILADPRVRGFTWAKGVCLGLGAFDLTDHLVDNSSSPESSNV